MLSEVSDYLDRIDDLRNQVRDLVSGLPAEALNWQPITVPAGDEHGGDHAMNSLAVLAAHVAGAEHLWIGEVVGGLAATRDREAEFAIAVEKAQPLVERLERVSVQSRQVLEQITREDLETMHQVGRYHVSSRWAILHVVDHSALHLGHMQITYQLWNSGKGVQSPRWYQRTGD